MRYGVTVYGGYAQLTLLIRTKQRKICDFTISMAMIGIIVIDGGGGGGHAAIFSYS